MRSGVPAASACRTSSSVPWAGVTILTSSTRVDADAMLSTAAATASLSGQPYTPALISGNATLRAPSSSATCSARR